MTARPKLLGAPRDVLEGGPLRGNGPKRRVFAPLVARVDDYTPGAGGALTGPESALSSLPACPCLYSAPHGNTLRGGTGRLCMRPSKPAGGRTLVCTGRHVFAGTPAEHEQARGALAAAERRAPHVQAERAGTRERLRAEVERAAGKGEGRDMDATYDCCPACGEVAHRHGKKDGVSGWICLSCEGMTSRDPADTCTELHLRGLLDFSAPLAGTGPAPR